MVAKRDEYTSFEYIYSTDLELHIVKQDRKILHTIKRRKANCIGHIFRRNCPLKHVIEGKIEGRIKVAGRRGRRRRHLLDDLKRLKPNDPYIWVVPHR